MDAERIRLSLPASAVDAGVDKLRVVILQPGNANGLTFSAEVVREAVSLFDGAPSFVDHAGWFEPHSVRELCGRIEDARWDAGSEAAGALVATLRLTTPHLPGLHSLLLQHAGQRYLGMSADIYVRRKGTEVESITGVNSVDVVVNPALGSIQGKEQQNMTAPVTPPGEIESVRLQTTAPAAPASDLISLHRQVAELKLAQAGLPPAATESLRQQLTASGENVDALLAAYRAAASALGSSPPAGVSRITSMSSSLDRLTLALERLMGVGETGKHGDVPRLSGIREFYHLVTGDREMRGLFDPEQVTLANATVTTMADVCADVLNKVLLRAFESRPQWWSPVVYEEDFASMQDPKWITLGGFRDLDVVDEGDPYTELEWEDYTEPAVFVKRGNYIGLTLEMIDRDDVGAVRALPRKLGLAAWRTLSSTVSALFTDNAGVGPTLADGVALFHGDRGNLTDAAFSVTAWDAAIIAMFTQAELGSDKRLGVRPRYCLVPIELERDALEVFTSDYLQGTGGDSQQANVRRNSGNLIVVPDWSDSDDWAAVADPGDLEGICIGYRFGRTPELFVADDPSSGAMFTNDELRFKVRFVFSVGIGDWRALFKSNVA